MINDFITFARRTSHRLHQPILSHVLHIVQCRRYYVSVCLTFNYRRAISPFVRCSLLISYSLYLVKVYDELHCYDHATPRRIISSIRLHVFIVVDLTPTPRDEKVAAVPVHLNAQITRSIAERIFLYPVTERPS